MSNVLKLFNKAQSTPISDLREITDLDTPIGREIIEIYEDSFPETEHDPVDNIAASLANFGSNGEVTHLL